MAKVKVDFTTEDIEMLRSEDDRADKIAELHAALDACIDSVESNVKASITIDTDKE